MHCISIAAVALPPILALASCMSMSAAAPAPRDFDFEVVGKEQQNDISGGRPVAMIGEVSLYGDIVYAQPDHYRPLRLDIYRAPGDDSRPMIVYVHGGAWRMGQKRSGGPVEDFPGVLAQLASRGYVVAAVEYRLDGEAPFPAAIRDVKAAIRYLRAHHEAYGIDGERVGIFGGSAGGQLAALAATSCGVETFSDGSLYTLGESDCVQAAVPWYGVYDFRTIPVPEGQTGPAPYLGCGEEGCDVATLAFGSPAFYVDADDPPQLLITGDADTLVAPSQTTEFAAALSRAGASVQTLCIPGVDHGLVGRDRSATHFAVATALQRTAQFFDCQLRNLCD